MSLRRCFVQASRATRRGGRRSDCRRMGWRSSRNVRQQVSASRISRRVSICAEIRGGSGRRTPPAFSKRWQEGKQPCTLSWSRDCESARNAVTRCRRSFCCAADSTTSRKIPKRSKHGSAIIQLPATLTDEQYQRTLEREQPALVGEVAKGRR